MKLRRVLVVYKKSAFQVYAKERKDEQFLSLVRRRHVVARRIERSHQAHLSALDLVREVLRQRKIQSRFLHRARPFTDTKYDLILSVGGDGTFLEASHCVLKKPILGLNSNPEDSVGIFCGARVESLDRLLSEIEHGKCRLTSMARLEARIGRRKTMPPILNDVLIAHSSPGGTSRYILRIDGQAEEQKSSGVWIAPPAGSTGAIRGAGGKFLPIESHRFQYRVREPYRQPGTRLRFIGNVVDKNRKVIIQSKSRASRIFIDGSHLSFLLPMGERLEIGNTGLPLKVFAFDEKRRRRFWL